MFLGILGNADDSETYVADIPEAEFTNQESFREKAGSHLDKLLQELFERLGYGK